MALALEKPIEHGVGGLRISTIPIVQFLKSRTFVLQKVTRAVLLDM